MATSDVFSLHTEGGFDLQDVIAAPLFSLAAVVITGIGSFTLFGYSLDQTLFSGSGVSISIAFVTALVALAASWATNRAGDGWDDLDDLESLAVGLAGIILLGMAFIPAVQDLVLGSQAIGAAAYYTYANYIKNQVHDARARGRPAGELQNLSGVLRETTAAGRGLPVRGVPGSRAWC